MSDQRMQDKDAREAVLAAIVDQDVRFILLWFTDITGIVKSVTIPAAGLANVIDHGMHFDGSSLEGFGRIAESDMLLLPDLSTFMILSWGDPVERTARLICTVASVDGQPFSGDPRNALARVLQQARDLGYTFKTGMELEYFLFRMQADGGVLPLTPYDDSSYFDISGDESQRLRRRMLAALAGCGIGVDSAHNEIGDGQHEIDLSYNEAMVSADNVVTARIAMRAIAQMQGVHCTFMPRPSQHLPGSGMHTHQSLHDAASDHNIFANPDHQFGLSETAQHFLAGQLAHARAMTAILAPLINSYKRLGVSFEAPKYVTWAHVNRAGEAVIRVPHVAPGLEAHTRLEVRCPDPSANPYLATAVMLAAGLDGIRQRMPLPAAFDAGLLRQEPSRLRQVAVLPSALEEALDALMRDDVIMAALGTYISDRYIAVKHQELAEYQQQVTQWEIDRYLRRY